VLRLEDVDSDRAGEAHIRSCIEDLRWLGLDWDGEPILQSTRTEYVRARADTLLLRGLAYPCLCTRKQLALAGSAEETRGAPHEAGPRYPGTCRDQYASIEAAEAETRQEAGLRFRVNSERIKFHDAVFGEYSEDLAETVGDFLILRRNKTPAYQLAVVADDHQDGVNLVVRGRDLLSSTARQIALARALGISSPRYAHVPLVCDAAGRRLAKRDNARSLAQLRAEGMTPERIVRWATKALGQGTSLPFNNSWRFEWSRIPRDDIVLPNDLGEVL
jgi:glutamyl-tRNA synthetase